MHPVATTTAVASATAALVSIARLIWRAKRAEESALLPPPEHADAIVVMGATAEPSSPCPELAARLDHAVALFQAGIAPVVVASGGFNGVVNEADVMAEYIQTRGVPHDRVLLDHSGDNTRATIRTLDRLRLQRFVVVSSPFHAYRIVTEGRRQGVSLTPSCPITPQTRNPKTHQVQLATEIFGCLWYSLPPKAISRIPVGRLRHSIPAILSGQPRKWKEEPA